MHGFVIDSDNHIMYFYYRPDNENMSYFANYNILTNADKCENDEVHTQFPTAYFIESAMYLKGFGRRGEHILRYLPESKECVDIMQNFPVEKFTSSQIGYDEKNRKIMLFGGYMDIWY